MKNVKFILLLILTGINARLSAQLYYNQRPDFINANMFWVFGDSTGIDFSSGRPIGVKTALTFAQEGSAVASDPETGELLFYSDGVTCWDRNHQVMLNGTGLLGSLKHSSTQGVVIVPFIHVKGMYYLFTVDHQGGSNGLRYSIVNMSLNGGLGAIEQKNILLHPGPLSEAMIAIPGDNCDIWLVAHAQLHPLFLSYRITSSGINRTPVLSTAGNPGMYIPLSNPWWSIFLVLTSWMVGGMTVSPDRTSISICNTHWEVCVMGPVVSGYQGQLLCKFDPVTGVVSNPVEVGNQLMAKQNAFSPDGTKLYTLNYDYQLSQFVLSQFDVTNHDSTAIAASRVDIPLPASFQADEHLEYLRLYRDTIYLGEAGAAPWLSTINQPNQSGTACDFQHVSVPLTDTVLLTLPTEVVYVLKDTSHNLLKDTLLCTSQGAAPSHAISAFAGFYGYEWDDGSTDQTRTINAPGTYWVFSKDSCHSRVDTFIIRHVDISFSLGADTVFCDRPSFDLEVDISDATYLWQDGSTNNKYTITGDGSFSVTVYKDGCSASDTIRISAKSFLQDLGEDTIFCKSDPIHLKYQANVPDGAKVKWSNGSTDASIVAKDTGIYWVIVNDHFCKDGDTVHIGLVVCDCAIDMPSGFSPNNDGLNDMFDPVVEPGCAVSGYSFYVYNRFGQLIFSSNQINKGWDGSYKGLPVDVGTYMYEMYMEGGRNKKKYYHKGDITLVR